MQNTEAKENVSEKKVNSKRLQRGSAIICTCILIAAVFAFIYNFFIVNKYNKLGYINTSGKTIGQIAEEQGIPLKTLLEEYGLPKNMRADTEEAAAYYTIPTQKIASMNGRTFEELKELYGWDDSIMPDTPWGIAQGETLLKYMYSSDKALNSFKKEYNLGEEVTGETKYKEVRDIVAQNSPNQKQLG